MANLRLEASIGISLLLASTAAIADGVRATQWCSPQSDGEVRMVTPQMPHGGALTANYKLLVSSDAAGKKTYDAILNLAFHPASPDVPQSALGQMEERFNACFKELGPIPGPDGERLIVRLPQAGDPGPVPDPTSIDVLTRAMPREERSNLWSVTSPCPLIIHETMHNLGLVDLYPEKGIGFSVDASGNWQEENYNAQYTIYNCRSTAKDGSVMSDAMIPIVYETKPQYYDNSCGCQTTKCARELDAMTGPPDHCPPDAESSDQPSVVASQFEINVDPDAMRFFKLEYEPLLKGYRPSRWTYEYVTVEPAKAKTILYPAEFRAITQPGCQTKDNLYYSCTKNSYRSTPDRVPPNQRTWQENSGCLVVPAECKDLTWLTE